MKLSEFNIFLPQLRFLRSIFRFQFLLLIVCSGLIFPGELSAQWDDDNDWTNFTTNSTFRGMVSVDDHLWIATEGGLLQLNKEDFSKTYFNRANSPLINNQVLDLAYDSDTNTIALAVSEGIQFYDLQTKTWTSFTNSHSPFPMDRVTRFAFGFDGSWWIGANSGLFHYYPDTGNWKMYTTRNSELTRLPVPTISVDKKHKTTWIAEHTIHKIDSTGKWTQIRHDSFGTDDMYFNDSVVDSSGIFWGVGRERVYSVHTDSQRVNLFTPNNTTLADGVYYIRMFVDRNDRKLFGFQNIPHNEADIYLPVFDENGWGKEDFIESRDVRSGSLIQAYHRDEDGTQFVGYSSVGLYNDRFGMWDIIPTNQSDFAMRYVSSLNADSAGRIWRSNIYEKKISLYDGEEWHSFDDFSSDYSLSEFKLTADPFSNRMWISGDVTGYWDSELNFNEIEHFSHSRTNDLSFDSTGTLWAVSRDSLYYLPRDSTHWTAFEPLPEHFSYDSKLRLGKDGDILLYINYRSLHYFDSADSTWTEYEPYLLDFFWGDDVFDLLLHPNGETWIAATVGMAGHGFRGNGIMVIKDGELLANYTAENSPLPHNKVNDIEVDELGGVWAATNEGLARFDGQKWHTFTTENSSIAENEAIAVTIDPSGDVWVSSHNYMSRFHNGIILSADSGHDEISERELTNLPQDIQLLQNYPNPFNPTTTLRFKLEKSQHISLNVYNSLGQHVRTLTDGMYSQGDHSVQFGAETLSSGIYLFVLKGENGYHTQKGILIK